MNLLEALLSEKKFRRVNTNYWFSEISNEENICGCYFPVLMEIIMRDGRFISGHMQPIIAEDIRAEDYELNYDLSYD